MVMIIILLVGKVPGLVDNRKSECLMLLMVMIIILLVGKVPGLVDNRKSEFKFVK